MEQKERKEKESRLLKGLYDTFMNCQIPATLDKETVRGNEIEILRVLYRDYIGEDNETVAEYYFLDTALNNPDALYFNGLITLKTDVDKATCPDLPEAVLRLNACLPFGAYLLNVDAGFLMFRMNLIVPADTDEQSLSEQLEINASHLIELSDKYSEVLLGVCEGKLTLEEFREVLNI